MAVRSLLTYGRSWGGTVLSLVCLWLVTRDIHFSEVAKALAQANHTWVILAVSLVLTAPLARAVRWRLLFYPRHRQHRVWKLVFILLIGQMINIVLPTRLGELARAHLMRELEGESGAFTLGTIVLEKLMDSIALLFFLFGVMLALPLPPWLRASAMVVIASAIVLLPGIAISAYSQGQMLRMLTWLLGPLPERSRRWAIRQSELVLSGLKVLRYWDMVLRVVLWSVLIMGIGALVNYATFAALGLGLPFRAAVFTLVVLQIGIAAPSAPGKVGVFHYLTTAALSVFSIKSSLAFSAAVLLHLIVILPPSVLGVLLLGWHNLALRRRSRVSLEGKPSP